jgi:hypothetical protein
MRAKLAATTAVLALGVLAACGSNATDSAGQSAPTSESQSESQSVKPAPEPPAVIVEPTPPAVKPQDPSGGVPPVTIGPDGPVAPAGVTEVPPSQVDASALPNYVEYGNKVWVYDDGYSLQMFASATSSCNGAEAVVVGQSADTVKIVVRPLAGPQGGRPDDGVCAMVMTPVPVTVRLDAPLRDRRIFLTAG